MCHNKVAFSYWFLGGRQPFILLDLHRKYGSSCVSTTSILLHRVVTNVQGPVVRTAPNELSFNTSRSFQDIYGFRHGQKTFIKSEFYDGGSFAARGVHSIVSERDPKVHGQMRRLLSPAFSNTSLREQEGLIGENIDRFIGQVKNKAQGHGQVFDISKVFESMMFDVIGDLAFGEPFGALERGEGPPSTRN